MRKARTVSESKGEGTRNRERASGSTDILAGTDAAFAIQRRDSADGAVVVECVKSREAEEEGQFVVSLRDEGNDGPVEMVYEGSAREFRAELRKTAQSVNLIADYLKTQPGQTAPRASLLAHLNDKGIRTRTGERALECMKKSGGVDQPERGLWRLLTRELSGDAA